MNCDGHDSHPFFSLSFTPLTHLVRYAPLDLLLLARDTPLRRRRFIFRAVTGSRWTLTRSWTLIVIVIVIVVVLRRPRFPAHAGEDDFVVRRRCVHDAEFFSREDFGEHLPAEGDEGDDEDGEAWSVDGWMD